MTTLNNARSQKYIRVCITTNMSLVSNLVNSTNPIHKLIVNKIASTYRLHVLNFGSDGLNRLKTAQQEHGSASIDFLQYINLENNVNISIKYQLRRHHQSLELLVEVQLQIYRSTHCLSGDIVARVS